MLYHSHLRNTFDLGKTKQADPEHKDEPKSCDLQERIQKTLELRTFHAKKSSHGRETHTIFPAHRDEGSHSVLRCANPDRLFWAAVPGIPYVLGTTNCLNWCFQEEKYKSRGGHRADCIFWDAPFLEQHCLAENTKASLWTPLSFPKTPGRHRLITPSFTHSRV